MAWVFRRILRNKHATTVLKRRLARETNVAVARDYGVAHNTVATWRAHFQIPPCSRGAGKYSIVQEALLHHMQPGQTYSLKALRTLIPGSRQQLYWILTRLTTEGQLSRHGTRNHYRWQRMPALSTKEAVA